MSKEDVLVEQKATHQKEGGKSPMVLNELSKEDYLRIVREYKKDVGKRKRKSVTILEPKAESDSFVKALLQNWKERHYESIICDAMEKQKYSGTQDNEKVLNALGWTYDEVLGDEEKKLAWIEVSNFFAIVAFLREEVCDEKNNG